MCRYMDSQRAAWVCLTCRVSVKLDGSRGGACTRCATPMLFAGRDFRAPRRRDRRQWEKVARLLRAGVTFDSCGCTGPGSRPRTLADERAWERDRARLVALPAAGVDRRAKLAARQLHGSVTAAVGAHRARGSRPDGVRA